MSRVYASANLDELMRLASGESITFDVVQAESDDEAHEFEALLEVADRGRVVVTAEVSAANAPIELKNIDAIHLDTDGSGDLSWFARQELIHVIEILTAEEAE